MEESGDNVSTTGHSPSSHMKKRNHDAKTTFHDIKLNQKTNIITTNKKSSTNHIKLILASLLFRFIFLLYGNYQDAHSDVKFTDIDYYVFTDAARYLSQGHSPYKRATYRYTPLLAYALLPATVYPSFGKLLFILCDVLSGMFITLILKHRKVNERNVLLYSAFWHLNPFMATICTRGSSEAVLSSFVLGSIYAFEIGKISLGSILFGLSVHLKIYPIIYVVPIWFTLDYVNTKQQGMFSSFFTLKRIQFGLVSGGLFIVLTWMMFYKYGYEFLHETYLYHIIRKDHRHNFSPYFYHLYLSYMPKDAVSSLGRIINHDNSNLTKLLAFIPQFGSVLAIGSQVNKFGLVETCFLQTFAFVTFNKVCTSQYFIWYLCLLFIALAAHKIPSTHPKQSLLMLILWVLGQALWLIFAFLLEIKGQSVFRELEAASWLFFFINIWILKQFIVFISGSYSLKLRKFKKE